MAAEQVKNFDLAVQAVPSEQSLAVFASPSAAAPDEAEVIAVIEKTGSGDRLSSQSSSPPFVEPPGYGGKVNRWLKPAGGFISP
jgi:hypothetical protein